MTVFSYNSREPCTLYVHMTLAANNGQPSNFILCYENISVFK